MTNMYEYQENDREEIESIRYDEIRGERERDTLETYRNWNE